MRGAQGHTGQHGHSQPSLCRAHELRARSVWQHVQALEGDIHSEQPPAPGLPPLAPALDLAAPGPQQLPRLWSALHDAFLYADPAQVQAYGQWRPHGSLKLVAACMLHVW